MHITLVRNASLLLNHSGVTFLIDPMLDPVGARPAVPNTPNPKPGPLVPVPENLWQRIDAADVLVLTHLHKDHFDDTARERIPSNIPVICHPEQVHLVKDFGFTNVTGLDSTLTLGDVRLTRTAGQHGTGEIGQAMAPVCGIVFESDSDTTAYVAGDTIWCEEVAMAITSFNPPVIVVNGGAGQFLQGDPITMTHHDVAQVASAAPDAKLAVVHLDAISHCLQTRSELRTELDRLGLKSKVLIPEDGEVFLNL